MFKILIIMIPIIILIVCYKNHVKIKFKTFFKKGFKAIRGIFGVYCYCGKQGTGKTYSIVEYLQDNKEKSMIWCNISDIEDIDYTFFTGFKELIKIIEDLDDGKINLNGKQMVIVYDEIFTELEKHTKLAKEVIDLLCQMRKRGIIFLTSCQEWPELPLTWRRFCRYQIQCRMINLFKFSILIKTFRDAENMKWSNDEQEHVAPVLETTISKCRKYIADSYDTMQRIKSKRKKLVVLEPSAAPKKTGV